MLLRKLFSSPDTPEERIKALKSAIKTGADHAKKRQLAYAIGELGDSAIIPLYKVLEEPDIDMQDFATLALTRVNNLDARLRALTAAASRKPLGYVDEAVTAVAELGEQAVEPLLGALTSSNPNVRSQASKALAKIGSPIVDQLIGALSNPNAIVREEVANALCQIRHPRTLPALLRSLEDPSEGVRFTVALYVRFFSDPTAIEPLVDILENPSETFKVRHAAAESLVDLGWTPAMESQNILLAVLNLDVFGGTSLIKGKDEDLPRDRQEHVVSYGNAATAHLIMALESADTHTKELAAQALGQIGDARARMALMKALEEGDYSVRHAAEEALTRVGVTSADIDTLAGTLESENDGVRSTAARMLSKTKDSKAIEPLLHALIDKEPHVRREAILGLGDIGHSRASAAIVAALCDSDRNVAEASENVLMRSGQTDLGRAAVEPLRSLLKHQDRLVRVKATQVLWKIADERATSALGEVLQSDPEAGIRRIAALGLGAIGNNDALQYLESGLNDQNADVSRTAQEMLQKLRIPKEPTAKNISGTNSKPEQIK